MESKSEKTGFENKIFRWSYLVIFVVIIALNALIFALLITSWFIYIPLYSPYAPPIIRIAFYIILISPIIKIGFAVYEVIRFVIILKSDKRDVETAYKVARGFVGTRIVRNYYLVILIIIVVISEIFEFTDRMFGSLKFVVFYTWFSIPLIIDIFLTAVGPHLIKFTIDKTNKERRIKLIVWSNVWIVVIILLFTLNYLILLFILLI
ncbi:MAG: hypothetical protein ACFFCI_08645 [Promethearchaeota archaeon]